MANTTNLNLVKPAGTDFALVSVINGNMDIIDSKVGAIPANESAQSQITALNNQLETKPTSWRISVLPGTSYSVSLRHGYSYLISFMTSSNASMVIYGITRNNNDIAKAELYKGSYASYFTDAIADNKWTLTAQSYGIWLNVIEY